MNICNYYIIKLQNLLCIYLYAIYANKLTPYADYMRLITVTSIGNKKTHCAENKVNFTLVNISIGHQNFFA